MKFDKTKEMIVTAWAEKCHGPGWGNEVVWVLIQRQGGGGMRMECLQPRDQTEAIRALFDVSDIVSKKMTAMVENAIAFPPSPEDKK